MIFLQNCISFLQEFVGFTRTNVRTSRINEHTKGAKQAKAEAKVCANICTATEERGRRKKAPLVDSYTKKAPATRKHDHQLGEGPNILNTSIFFIFSVKSRHVSNTSYRIFYFHYHYE